MSGRGTATVQRPRRGRAARAKELRPQRAQIALPAAVGACSIGGTACAAREPKLPERRHASTVHAEQGAPRRPGRHDRAAKPRDQQSASVNAGDRTECRPPAAPARPWRALGSSGAAGPCGRAWRAASCPPRPPLAARRPPSGWRSGELLRVGPEPASPGRGRPAPAPRLLGPGNVGNRAGAEAPQPPAAAACTDTLGAGRAPAPTPPCRDLRVEAAAKQEARTLPEGSTRSQTNSVLGEGRAGHCPFVGPLSAALAQPAVAICCKPTLTLALLSSRSRDPGWWRRHAPVPPDQEPR